MSFYEADPQRVLHHLQILAGIEGKAREEARAEADREGARVRAVCKISSASFPILDDFGSIYRLLSYLRAPAI
jgi:hypothetical protein